MCCLNHQEAFNKLKKKHGRRSFFVYKVIYPDGRPWCQSSSRFRYEPGVNTCQVYGRYNSTDPRGFHAALRKSLFLAKKINKEIKEDNGVLLRCRVNMRDCIAVDWEEAVFTRIVLPNFLKGKTR